MNKQDKIKLALAIVREIEAVADKIGGFGELDQTEIEFLHKELLHHVSHSGLDKYISMLKEIKKDCNL